MANFRNTEDMYYNLSQHRYVLTEEGFARNYGIQLSSVLNTEGDLDPDTLPHRFLERVSQQIYTYIYNWSNDRDQKEYMISKEQYRQTIQDAMGELAYAWLLNNTDPNVFFKQTTKKLIELVPSVHNILLNGKCLQRGRYIMMPQGWQDTKGTDY